MKALLSILIFLLFQASAFSQWTQDTSKNTLAADLQTEDLMSVGTSDNKTYIAFWHNLPAPANYELRLQLLDNQGNPLFGKDGMVLDNTANMSTYITTWSIAIDQDDNVYVGFNATGSNTDAIVHKVSSDGIQLWGNSGIKVGSGYDVKVLPLKNGEVVVSWLPGNQGVFQKYDDYGQALFTTPINILPNVPNHKTSAGEMLEMSNGDISILIHDRSGNSPSAVPFMQRYKGIDGSAVWPTNLALTDGTGTSFNRRYDMIAKKDTIYFGYSGALGLQFNSYLQRINPDGSLPWGLNGIDFSTQSVDYEIDTKISAEEEQDNIIWAICTYTDPSQGMAGEYSQKFNVQTGERLLGDLAVEVYPISSDYISHASDLKVYYNRPFFLITAGNSNGVFPIDIRSVTLWYNGQLKDFEFYKNHSYPVATNPNGVKSRIHLNNLYNNTSTAVWVENRPSFGEPRPFAHNVYAVIVDTKEKKNISDIHIYPNPAQNEINIHFKTQENGIINCTIRNVHGQTVYKQSYKKISNTMEINIPKNTSFSAGIYFIELKMGNYNKIKKLIIY